MKRFSLRPIAALLALVLCLTALVLPAAAAKDPIYDLALDSQGVYVQNLETGAVIYEKASAARMCPASLTKIATALVVLESVSDPLSEIVTVTDVGPIQYIVEEGGVNMQLVRGDTFTVYDLLVGLLLASYCDAADLLALHVAGSVDAFVIKMNEKAAALGLENTHFENAHGLNAANHYSSPADLAVLFRAALQNETFRAILPLRSYTIPATPVHAARAVRHTVSMFNPDNAYYLDAFVGGKSGFTDQAGRCLAAYSVQNGVSYVSVLLGANLDANRRYPGNMAWIETNLLISYAYENFTVRTLFEKGQEIALLPVVDSEQSLPVICPEKISVLTRPEAEPSYETVLPASVPAPEVADGKEIGELKLLFNEEESPVSYPLVLKWDGVPIVTKSALEKGAESAAKAISGIFREDRAFVILLILLLAVIAISLPALRIARRLHNKKSHRPKH